MTRADSGRRHKWWRESELAYIREHAGRVPAREIRKALRVMWLMWLMWLMWQHLLEQIYERIRPASLNSTGLM